MKKRPLFVVTLGSLLGALVILQTDQILLVWCGIFSAYCLAMLLFKQQQRILSMLALGTCLAFLASYVHQQHILQHSEYVMQLAQTNGVVGTVIEHRSYETFDLYRVQPREPKTSMKIRLMIEKENTNTAYRPGDLVYFSGDLLPPSPPRNPGGYHEKHNHYGSGIYLSGWAKDHRLGPEPRVMAYAFLDALQQHLGRKIRQLYPEPVQGFIQALLLGRQEDLDQSLKDTMQDTGLAHLLAISGLHLGFLALGLYKLLKGLPEPIKVPLVGVFTLFYIALTGFQVSTLRAGIMLIVFLVSKLLLVKYDGLSALSLVVLVMILKNPYHLYRIGFLLSVTAVLGLLIIGPMIHAIRPDAKWLKGVAPLVAIQLMTIPIQLYYFYQVPLLSVPLNLLIMPIMGVVLSLGVLAIGVLSLIAPLAQAIAFLVTVFVTGLIYIATLFQQIPYTVWRPGRLAPGVMVLYYGTLALWWYLQKRKYAKHLVCVLVMVTLSVHLTLGFIEQQRLEMVFLDVGQGDSTFIHYKGRTLMVDAGGEAFRQGPNVGARVIVPYLNYRGINHIDLLFITHMDFDHLYGLFEIVHEVSIGTLIVPSVYDHYETEWALRLKALAKAHQIPIRYSQVGDVFALHDLTLTCLYPMSDQIYEDNNDHSLVLKVEKGQFDALLMGDANAYGELALLNHHPDFQVDVLKVSHHGSNKASHSDFLSALKPNIGIISCSKNNRYNHPGAETLARLKTHDIKPLITYETGAIRVYYQSGMVYDKRSMLEKGKVRYPCKP